MQRVSSKISNSLYALRAFACLIVIAAHMTFSQEYPIAEIIRTSLGQIGVKFVLCKMGISKSNFVFGLDR